MGANSTVVCGTTIGRYAFVGAGSVVTRDVPDYGLVYGNPARLRGWMCACGIGLEFTGGESEGRGKCPACGAEYRKVGQGVTTGRSHKFKERKREYNRSKRSERMSPYWICARNIARSVTKSWRKSRA